MTETEAWWYSDKSRYWVLQSELKKTDSDSDALKAKSPCTEPSKPIELVQPNDEKGGRRWRRRSDMIRYHNSCG